jgi:hypothetical protein
MARSVYKEASPLKIHLFPPIHPTSSQAHLSSHIPNPLFFQTSKSPSINYVRPQSFASPPLSSSGASLPYVTYPYGSPTTTYRGASSTETTPYGTRIPYPTPTNYSPSPKWPCCGSRCEDSNCNSDDCTGQPDCQCPCYCPPKMGCYQCDSYTGNSDCNCCSCENNYNPSSCGDDCTGEPDCSCGCCRYHPECATPCDGNDCTGQPDCQCCRCCPPNPCTSCNDGNCTGESDCQCCRCSPPTPCDPCDEGNCTGKPDCCCCRCCPGNEYEPCESDSCTPTPKPNCCCCCCSEDKESQPNPKQDCCCSCCNSKCETPYDSPYSNGGNYNSDKTRV